MSDPLTALYEDASCVVVAKPAGLLVHNTPWAGARERSVTEMVRTQYDVSLAPVHRLDRGTSGALLFARGSDAARRWQEALARDDADKRYLALVRGVVRAEVLVDHAYADEEGERRDARTWVTPLLTRDDPRCSLVCARPLTGRTHQVRRHLKHLSHPVIGDANYGKGALNREYAARYGLARLALHAWTLALTHPDTGARLHVTAPLPDDLAVPLAHVVGATALAEVLASTP